MWDDVVELLQDLFAVDERDFFVWKCQLTHIINAVRGLSLDCVQVASHQKEAIDSRRILLDLGVGDACVNIRHDGIAGHQGGQFIIDILICLCDDLADDVIATSRKPECFRLALVIEVVDD